jgi:pilus assembly protein Flp/PilA
MKAVLSKFMKDESGQGLVEYALIIALVAIGLIAILVVFRNSIGRVFSRSAQALNNAPSGSYAAP